MNQKLKKNNIKKINSNPWKGVDEQPNPPTGGNQKTRKSKFPCKIFTSDHPTPKCPHMEDIN